MLRRHALPILLAPMAKAQDRFARIQNYIDSQVADGPFAGIHGALLHRGKLVFNHTAGQVQSDTIYRIHSMTKPIASAALMALYEEGKFLLDEPLAKYVPGFANTQVLTVENDPASPTVPLKRPITIQHILTHTSGLFNMKAYQSEKVFSNTLATMAQNLPRIPLAHQPGEAWRYGQSINVVGLLVEHFSGKPLDVFLKERFFTPLKMNDTDFHVPTSKSKRLATTYMLDAANKLQPQTLPSADRNPTFLAGSGGLFSTTHDYLRFTQMMLNNGTLDGSKILSPATVDFMFRNHVPLNLFPAGGPNNRTGYGFGIGGAILMNAAESATLSIDGEYTWGGAAGTYFWIDRKSQLAGVWCVQRPPFTQPPSKRFKVLAYQAIS
jgi:CubicO group peptidase (beta-lactamase class C family)